MTPVLIFVMGTVNLFCSFGRLCSDLDTDLRNIPDFHKKGQGERSDESEKGGE